MKFHTQNNKEKPDEELRNAIKWVLKILIYFQKVLPSRGKVTIRARQRAGRPGFSNVRKHNLYPGFLRVPEPGPKPRFQIRNPETGPKAENPALCRALVSILKLYCIFQSFWQIWYRQIIRQSGYRNFISARWWAYSKGRSAPIFRICKRFIQRRST